MRFIHFFISRPALCCCLFMVLSPACSMSPAPDDIPETGAVLPADTQTEKLNMDFVNRDPEADAQAAINQGDFRLLGFATRKTNLPGVKSNKHQQAIDTCGVRLIEGFGDVMSKDEKKSARKQAHEYAKRYNKIVLKACSKNR